MTPDYQTLSRDRIEREKSSIFGFFITRTRLSILLIAAIVFGGLFALFNIPREADPEVRIPFAVVTTPYPGAGPSDVEALITDEIERKIEDLDDVKLVTSQSTVGLSNVSVEFEADADLDESVRELRDKILEVRGLPDGAEDPIVTQIRANDTPIITYSLAGDLTLEELEDLAEDIQDELESISGVSEVAILGDRDREFQVTINRAALARSGLSLGAVIGTLQSSNFDMPLGELSIDNIDYNFRTTAKYESVEDIRNVVLADVNGSIVTVGDIATVEDSYADQETESRISIGGEPAVNTISLQLRKKTGGNILDIVDTSKERLDEMKLDGRIPECCSVEVTNDFSQFIRRDLQTLGTSGVFTVILIFIIIYIALSVTEAFISLLAVPFTFFITFFVLNAAGYTLNSLSLFSLVLSLGLLVDTFIVVMEGVFHNLRKGYKALDAALLSVSHYKKPLFAGVFTTISAFVPMLLVSGILGEYLKVLPITISITLLSSLFVSLVLVPMMSAVFMRKEEVGAERRRSFLERHVTDRLGDWYYVKVKHFLGNKKQKKRFSFWITMAFLLSFAPLVTGLIPVQLFPNVDVDFTFVDVEMPIGSSLSETNEAVGRVEDYLYTRDDIKSFVSTVGQTSTFGSFGETGSTKSHLATITVNFVDAEERDVKSFDIIDEMRDDLKDFEGALVAVREVTGGPPTGAPIEARIVGDDLADLSRAAEVVESVLRDTEGVVDIESNESTSPAEFTFALDRERLARAGLSVGEVSTFLRTVLYGMTVTEINLEEEEVDVVVQFEETSITSVDDIQNLSIPTARGEQVKVAAVTDFSLQPALATIRHRDFKKTLTVRANLKPGFNPASVTPQIEATLADREIPSGTTVSFGGEVEDIDQSFNELWSAMIVAVLLILTILVLQFNSFKQPFAILMTLPLMLIGVVFGMLVLGLPFSFSTFLGLVALAGIVVNDAIVLLDKANRNRKELGMSARDAVADAGLTRLQPIILTSVTTIAGVIPLALADEFWFGLSTAIAFGLAFATILTLVVVPMLYLRFSRPPKSQR